MTTTKPAKKIPAKKISTKPATPTPDTTPAEIPAETAVAQHSQHDPAFPIADIVPHPKNPRHNAVADDELLQSLSEVGVLHDLTVAPHATEPGKMTLIDGHCRLDGITRLGFTFAPVKIRLDLTDEADQVAAMLATTRRTDLTAVEEAEGFDTLMGEHGWTVEQVSAKTGRAKSTVLERRKLTKLRDQTKSAVDTGQITIDDGIRISKLPAAEQKKLEGLVGTPDFRWQIGMAEDRQRRQRDFDAEVKSLRDRGVPELEQPKDANYIHSLSHALHGMVQLSTTGKPDANDHAGCLAVVLAKTTNSVGVVWYVCTDPAKHDAELTDAQAARAKEQAEASAAEQARVAEIKARRESQRVASLLRADDVLAAIKPKATLDPVLDALVRAAMPGLLYDIADYVGFEKFFEIAKVPEDKRWTDHYPTGDEPWFTDVNEMTGPAVLKLVAALFLAIAEDHTERAHDEATLTDPDLAIIDHRVTDAYFGSVLALAGHELNSADQELLDAVNQAADAKAS